MTEVGLRFLLLIVICTAPQSAPAADRPAVIGYIAQRSGPWPLDAAFLAGMKDQGMIEGKDFVMEYRWTPDTANLPAAASDLRAGYMPDGRHWGVFAFRAADEPAVRPRMGEEITAGPLECDPPGRLEFWPRVLRTPIDLEKVRSTGFRLYRGTDGRQYAINWGQGRVYYWR